MLAIIIGGAWGYIKFVRGRTFNKRGELKVSGSLLSPNGTRAIKVCVLFRNTGLTRIHLSTATRVVRIYSVSEKDWSQEAIDWGKSLRMVRVFERHQWVEGQEVIADEALVPVPDPSSEAVAAYKLECRLGGVSARHQRKALKPRKNEAERPKKKEAAQRKPGGRSIGVKWTDYTIVPDKLAIVERKTKGS